MGRKKKLTKGFGSASDPVLASMKAVVTRWGLNKGPEKAKEYIEQAKRRHPSLSKQLDSVLDDGLNAQRLQKEIQAHAKELDSGLQAAEAELQKALEAEDGEHHWSVRVLSPREAILLTTDKGLKLRYAQYAEVRDGMYQTTPRPERGSRALTVINIGSGFKSVVRAAAGKYGTQVHVISVDIRYMHQFRGYTKRDCEADFIAGYCEIDLIDFINYLEEGGRCRVALIIASPTCTYRSPMQRANKKVHYDTDGAASPEAKKAEFFTEKVFRDLSEVQVPGIIESSSSKLLGAMEAVQAWRWCRAETQWLQYEGNVGCIGAHDVFYRGVDLYVPCARRADFSGGSIVL